MAIIYGLCLIQWLVKDCVFFSNIFQSIEKNLENKIDRFLIFSILLLLQHLPEDPAFSTEGRSLFKFM